MRSQVTVADMSVMELSHASKYPKNSDKENDEFIFHNLIFVA